VHHRTCRITAHRFPLVHIDTCVPPTTTYLQYRVIGLTPSYGGRAFAVTGPTVWNSLPDFIRDPSCSQHWLFQTFAEDVSVCAILLHAAHQRLITFCAI